jgi:hypothetical protein
MNKKVVQNSYACFFLLPFWTVLSSSARRFCHFEWLVKWCQKLRSSFITRLWAMSPRLQNNNVWRQKHVLSADNCGHLHLSFFGFERTFYYALNWHFFMFWTIYQKLATQQCSRWMSASAYCCFSVSTNAQFQKFLKELLDSALAYFLPQMIAKHLLSRQKMSVEPTTETILWRQISDLSGQFSDHSSQILSVQKFKSVGDMGHWC